MGSNSTTNFASSSTLKLPRKRERRREDGLLEGSLASVLRRVGITLVIVQFRQAFLKKELTSVADVELLQPVLDLNLRPAFRPQASQCRSARHLC
jgi:hypothetical protein